MSPNKATLLAVVLLVATPGLCRRSRRSSSHHDIEFSSPDLSAIFEGEHGEEPLTAYKVANKSEWVSVGNPYIVKSANGTPSYVFTPEAINVNIRLLSKAQREALVHAAREKYPNIIAPVINLIPLQRFTCDLVIFDGGQRHLLQGHVHQLHRYTTVLEMSYPEGSMKRCAFENRIKRDEPIVWKCLLLAHGHVHRSNTLKLDVARIQSALSLGSIFGNGTEAYVTRKQLTDITLKVRSVVSMEEIIYIGEEGFSEQFKNQVLNLAATEFAQVDIDEALSKMAKFGTNFDSRDLSPTEIKQELSKVLKISNDSSNQRIYASNDSRRSGSHVQGSSEDIGVKAGLSAFLVTANVDASVNVAKENANRWKNSDSSIDDQLREINTASRNDVLWERRGSVIVPKSINMARLNRAALETEKSFLATKTIIRDASYSHPIELDSHKLEVSSGQEQLHRMNARIVQTAEYFQTLADMVDEQIVNLAHNISETEQLARELVANETHGRSALNTRVSSVASAVSDVRWSITQQLHALDTKFLQLQQKLHQRGPYLKSIAYTVSCQTICSDDDNTYRTRMRTLANTDVKFITCAGLGSEYFLNNMFWSESRRGSIAEASFECCKIILKPTTEGLNVGL